MGNHKGSVEPWGYELLDLWKQREVTKAQHRKGHMIGACDLQSRDAVSLSNHPRTKLGDFSLTHLPPPSSCWCIPRAKSKRSQRAREPFETVLISQSHREEEAVHLKKKGKRSSIGITWIAHIYPELRQGWSIFWTTTYTNRFLDEILITSTSFILAATLGKHLSLPRL